MRKGKTYLIIAASIVVSAAIVFGCYAFFKKPLHRSIKRDNAAAGLKIKMDDPKEAPKANAKVASVTHPAGAPKPQRELGNTPPPIPKNLPSPEELREQFRMLKSFLELPPERLARIRESIEKIEAMPPEQKSRLLAAIRESGPSTNSLEHRIEHANTILKNLPKETQPLIELRTRGYSPERRADFIEGYASACEDALRASGAKPTKAK